MKTSFVIKSNKIKKIGLDYVTIVLSTLFICGIIIGVALFKNCDEELKNTFFKFLNNYISAGSQGSFFSIFSGLLVLLMLFIFFEFVLGLSALGAPLILVLLVFFGVFCGVETSCVILNWGLKGVFYLILVNLPCYTITAAILIKCCGISVNMSTILLNYILGKDIIKRKFCDFKEYVLNYLILSLPVIIGTLISTIFFRIFCSLFVVV